MLLSDQAQPAYPEYDELLAEARRLSARPGIDPADLALLNQEVHERGLDWATSVLGRTYLGPGHITVVEMYILLVAADRGIEPPLPPSVVEARAAVASRAVVIAEQRRFRREADVRLWEQARQATDVELAVYANTKARPRYGLSEHLGHAVPAADVYSGTARNLRTHAAGRALCESETRTNTLQLRPDPEPDGTPVTCIRCRSLTPKVRNTR